MESPSIDQLRYPVGQYEPPLQIDAALRKQWMQTLGSLTANIRTAIEGLSEEQLDTPYRPEGWTVRQVIHHLPDSHMNSYIRFKLALTEDHPAIRPYAEDRWAELKDYQNTPVEVSLALLDSLHYRWVTTLENMKEEEWSRTLFHPESKQSFRLDVFLGNYDWHSRHHLAHITTLKERQGW